MKKLLAIFVIGISTYQVAHAQSNQAGKEKNKSAALNMLQFLSTGDTNFYSQAITDWNLSKDAYARTASSSDIDRILRDGYLQLIDANLMMYDRYFEKRIITESPDDRTKKISAGGKDFKVSKASKRDASNMAEIVDGK